MSKQNERDEALFAQLGQAKKDRRKRVLRTALIVLAVVILGGVLGIGYLTRQVREKFGGGNSEVLAYPASRGTISTLVSGSGVLENEDMEAVTVPGGVEISEVLVEQGDSVEVGTVLASVDMDSVRTAMGTLQDRIQELDEQIADAADDKVASGITAGISGRVKRILAEAGDDVVSTMVEHGALAVLSLDGNMAVDIAAEGLEAGQKVRVALSDGSEVAGTVEKAAAGQATVLLTDNGPEFDEEVAVLTEDGTEIAGGKLYIHMPLAVTGYAGTVSAVKVRENAKVSASTRLFSLTDTETAAQYDALLRQRGETEETLLELLAIMRYGGVTAPVSGSVFSLTETTQGEAEYEILTISRDEKMSVSISVDESDILSLKEGQSAEVQVSSLGEEALEATVTEVDTAGSAGTYGAQVTLEKEKGMLSGMTASVDIRIEGVENAILIPVDALHRTSAVCYVYTGYDPETRQYSGKVEVEAGLSNSNYVEIVSGLEEGTVVYYTESMTILDMFMNMMTGGGSGPDMERPPEMERGPAPEKAGDRP